MILHRFLRLKGRDDFFDPFVDEARDLRELTRFGSTLRFKFFSASARVRRASETSEPDGERMRDRSNLEG
jgi:hypothetical protein